MKNYVYMILIHFFQDKDSDAIFTEGHKRKYGFCCFWSIAFVFALHKFKYPFVV